MKEQKTSNTFPQTPLSCTSCCMYSESVLYLSHPGYKRASFQKYKYPLHLLISCYAMWQKDILHRGDSTNREADPALEIRFLWPCISPGAATSNPVYTAPLQEGIVTLKTSKCLKRFPFRLSCREVSSRALDLLFHQKIREGKFVGDQTNTNTLEETVGEAGEIVGLNKSGGRISTDPGGLFSPRSSHPADPKTPPNKSRSLN